LSIIDSYFPDYPGDKSILHKAALDFAHQNAAKNGRTARQFFNAYGSDKLE
jgi:predicted AAA+ superfamily ATPase